MNKNKRITIAITAGDPNGIGPEIAIKTAALLSVRKICTPLIYGSHETISDTATILGLSLKNIEIVDTGRVIKSIGFGKVSANAGEESIRAIDCAVKDIRKGIVKAIVTAPISKEAVVKSGLKKFTGHTGYIAEAAGNPFHVLALFADNKCISFVTLHASVRNALLQIKRDRIVKTTILLDSFLKKIVGRSAKIAISGLNPHAGESEILGFEEATEIIPAIKMLQKKGVKVAGPLPPDVVFPALFSERFNGVVSMLHDHGHVAFKTALFKLNKRVGKTGGVNVTLGLPFVRTSVDHGTAFDIAGQNIADIGSLVDAINLAVRLSQ